LAERDTRLECRVGAEQVDELLSDSFVDFGGGALEWWQIKRERACCESGGGLCGRHKCKWHLVSLAVCLNGSLQSIASSDCNLIGLFASIFDADVRDRQDIKLVRLGLGVEHRASGLDLLKEDLCPLGWSSNNGTSSGETS